MSRPREEYTVGWVCALPVELAAVLEMLDEEHQDLPQNENDSNLYTLGRISGHNVVIACLPEGHIGSNPAAALAVQMQSTFRAIQFCLMVGIGGGVPSGEADIRLGDVVVSRPHEVHGGVVQYDFGRATQSGFKRTGFLNTPPPILLSAVAKLRANHMRGRSKLSEHFSKFNSLPLFTRTAAGPDVLYEAEYSHVGGPTCQKCSKERVVDRPSRGQEVVIHYGTIASGNQVMRNAAERDTVSSELGGVLCFEMEAAGLMNSFPCLVIRGICDYADSHKNKSWQAHAAGTAAAFTKELLSVIPPIEEGLTRIVDQASEKQSDKISVLFVDYGNSCRSPMAEAIFKHHAKDIRQVGRVDSAGAGGPKVLMPTDGRTIRTLLRHAIDVGWRYPRPVIPGDLTNFHYILAVDIPTLNRLNTLQESWQTFGQGQIRLLGEFSESKSEEVIDPYAKNEGAFEELFSQLTRLCLRLLGNIAKDG